MTFEPSDYRTTIPCTRCGRPVEIRVDGRLLASEAIAAFYRQGALCKSCHQEKKHGGKA